MTLANELKKAAKRLVWLLEIEAGKRIDSLAWTKIVGHVYVTDSGNHRIKDLRDTDLEYLQQFGSNGAGDNQFDYPWGIVTDGIYLYITDQNNARIKKHLARDLSYVAKFGSIGAGNNNFDIPRAIATDGTYLYIVDSNNQRVKKHRCDDLSYVGQYTGIANGDDHDIASPQGCCIEGDHLWIHCAGGNNRFHKVNKDTLAYIAHYHYTTGVGDNQFNTPYEMDSDGTYLYIFDQNNERIKKHLASDFSFVSKYGSWTGVCANPDCFVNGRGIHYRSGYLYILDFAAPCYRIKKHLAADLSYIAKNGHFGAPTDGNNYVSASTSAAIEVVTYTTPLAAHPGRIRVVNRATGVVEEYTEVFTSEDCEWMEESWYYDEAAAILYLHMEGGVDPGAGGFYVSKYLWKKFVDGQYPAPEEIVFNGEWIRPRLKKDSIPDLTQEISGFDEGGVRQTWGTMILENADGELDEEIVDFIWENKIYILKVGSPGDAYGDYTVISRGRTGSISWTEKEITIGVGDPMKGED